LSGPYARLAALAAAQLDVADLLARVVAVEHGPGDDPYLDTTQLAQDNGYADLRRRRGGRRVRRVARRQPPLKEHTQA
jgi:hypothetical protein